MEANRQDPGLSEPLMTAAGSVMSKARSLETKMSETAARRIDIKHIEKAYRMPLLLAAWWLMGTLAFMYFEDYNWQTSVFVVAQIVTTVGYGDIVPESQGMKLFVAFYALFGIAIVAGIVDNLAEGIIATAQEAGRARMRQIEDALVDGLTEEDVWQDQKTRKLNKFIMACFIWLCTLAIGTFYWGYLDNCECADGVKACSVSLFEQDCPEDQLRTYIDAFYMCVITMTTVGFGDQTPQTKNSRLVSTAWMILGIAATANMIGRVSDVFFTQRKVFRVLNRKLFDKIDKDENNQIHKWQFLQYMLVKYDLVDQEDIDFIMLQFNSLDRSGDGVLSLEDLPCHTSEHSKLHRAMQKINILHTK